MKLADSLPCIFADPDQLQQVLLNLVNNSRDAMPKGGCLTLTSHTFQKNGSDFLELKIKDSGEGISPENIHKLFEPFFTTKPEGEGTGLGLAVCQGIIEAHGGAISVESMVGQGTTFIIQLPAAAMIKTKA
jgi:signal transduction histidine kinase